ncbi:MAG: hypothetical protein CMP11_01550 [Zetaproteobacteria bacterium]|nr:hypothetical protein [Pseudobdellovibrionaceae bacterium]
MFDSENIKLLIVFLTLLICLGISLFYAKKNKNQEDHHLAGKRLGISTLVLTLLATQVGGGAIVGTTELAFEYGWNGFSYSFGIATGLLVLCLGVGHKIRALNVKTIPEIFSIKYKSSVLHKLSAAASVVTLFFILIAIGVSTKKFCTFLGLNNPWMLFALAFLFLAYTSFGGFSAIVKTEILQITYILILTVVVIFNIETPFKEALSLAEQTKILIPPFSFSNLLSDKGFLLPIFFTIIGQDMGQRCAAAQNPLKFSVASLIAGILILVVSFVPVALGIIARIKGLYFDNNTCLILHVLEKETSLELTNLFAVGILFAILSTADSLICAISLNVHMDLMPHEKRSKIIFAKIFSFLFGLSAIVIANYFDQIIPVIIFAYELFVVLFFVPIFMAVCLKNPSKLSAYSTIFLTFTLWLNHTLSKTQPLGLFAILFLGALIFLAVELGVKNLPRSEIKP